MKLTYQQELTRRKQITDNPFQREDLRDNYTALKSFETTWLNLDLLPQDKGGVEEFTHKYWELFTELIKMSGSTPNSHNLDDDYLNIQHIAESSLKVVRTKKFEELNFKLAKMQYQFLVFQFGQKDAECLVTEWAITEELLLELRKSLCGKEYHLEKKFDFSELPDLEIENWASTLTDEERTVGRGTPDLPY